jgi:hypothetical protein
VFIGSTATTVSITGSRFVPGALVRVNGSNRPTSFISPTELRASIPATDLTQIGSLPIAVFTPLPGGGTSATLHLGRLAQRISVT